MGQTPPVSQETVAAALTSLAPDCVFPGPKFGIDRRKTGLLNVWRFPEHRSRNHRHDRIGYLSSAQLIYVLRITDAQGMFMNFDGRTVFQRPYADRKRSPTSLRPPA
jgi:hypothetical protein